MDVNSPIKAFGTLDLGSSRTTDLKVTESARDAQVATSLVVRLPISSSSTVPATPSLNNISLPPQASLLGLPQELRDQIYGYLTEDENRIILGWRFVENYKRHYPTLSYEDCFTSAIALHPLSMTCKQMLNDFQPALLRATKTRWTFFINNFDLEQLQFFSDYVNNGISIKLTDRWLAAAAREDYTIGFGPWLEYNVQLRLRFQMDKTAISSFTKLCDFHLSRNPDKQESLRAFQCLKDVHTEAATVYRPRTSAQVGHISSMTEAEARFIDSSFGDLEFKCILDDEFPEYKNYVEYCNLMYPWKEALSRAVKDTWDMAM